MAEPHSSTIASSTFSDANEFSDAIIHSDVVCTQTSKGRFQLDWTQAEIGRFHIQLMKLPVGDCVALGASAPVMQSIHVPLDRSPVLKLMGAEAAADRITMYGARSEHWIQAGSGAALAYVVPAPGLLESESDTAFDRPLRLPGSGAHILAPAPKALERLRRLLREIWTVCTSTPEAIVTPSSAQQIDRLLVEAILATVSTHGERPSMLGRAPRSRASIMRGVEDYLRSAELQPVNVKDLCAAVGISQPTLHRVFRDAFDMCPKQFLLIRHLHLARRQLLATDHVEATVSAIAFDCGFWHLGRFGRSYKALFGEEPSRTLRRSRETTCRSGTRAFAG